jgi:S1-C subfamily serine protease
MRHVRLKRRSRIAACAGFTGCLLALGAAHASAQTVVRSSPALSALESFESAFTEVAESVSKSVVSIRVEARRKLVSPFGGLPFGEWFGMPEGHEQYQIQRGTGSGVVIRSDGYILTNKHVWAPTRSRIICRPTPASIRATRVDRWSTCTARCSASTR